VLQDLNSKELNVSKYVVLDMLTEERDALLAQTQIALYVLLKINVTNVMLLTYSITTELALLIVKTEPTEITLLKNVYHVKKVVNYVLQRIIAQNVKKDYTSTLEFV
jgi:hypothetical protein